jgi:hypothetical protein
MSRWPVSRAYAPVILLSILLAVLVASSLLIFPLSEKSGEAKAAETDSGVGQCEEDYAFCRGKCDGEQSCLTACLQAYNACRRRRNLDQ